jgi:hypothetical protein
VSNLNKGGGFDLFAKNPHFQERLLIRRAKKGIPDVGYRRTA